MAIKTVIVVYQQIPGPVKAYKVAVDEASKEYQDLKLMHGRIGGTSKQTDQSMYAIEDTYKNGLPFWAEQNEKNQISIESPMLRTPDAETIVVAQYMKGTNVL